MAWLRQFKDNSRESPYSKVGIFRVRNCVCSVCNYGICPGNGDVINDSGNPDPKTTLWRMLFLTHNSVQGWALTIKTTVTRGHKDPRIVYFRLSITRAGIPGAMWKEVICSQVVSGAILIAQTPD